MFKLIGIAALLTSNAAFSAVDAPLQQCAKVTDDTQRLACFDNYIAAQTMPVEQAKVAAQQPKVAPVPAPETSTAVPFLLSSEDDEPDLISGPKSPQQQSSEPSVAVTQKSIEDNFGFEHKKTKEELENEALQFTIAKAKKSVHGKWTITFTNEQKWTTLSNERMKFKAGQTAIISRGMFNSFSLKLPNSNRSVKIKRVK